jgi:signal transduction histidine kinase
VPSYAPPRPRAPWRLGPRGQRWFDRLLVVFLVLPAPSWLIGIDARWLFTLFPVLQIVPLWWRRTHPVASFAAVAVATGAQALFVAEPLYGQIAFAIAVYSVARYAALWAGLAAVGVGLAGAVVAAYRWVGHYYGGTEPSAGTMVTYVVTIAAIVLTAWALGLSLQSRARYVDGLVERAEQAVRAADQQAALAAADERARIARDMHDVVAHGLSVIVVQADGARYAAAANPQAVTPALETIAATGRSALADMRRMLGLLRSESAVDARPQPRLADIADLVAEARAAGTRVEADLPPPSVAVSDGVALTTYRVVQEALSNVRRHAGPDPAVRVRVRVDGPPPAVSVEVEDDGRGAASHHDGRGLGLVGMRERVALHGGEVSAGPRPGGGFRLRARIPGG